MSASYDRTFRTWSATTFDAQGRVPSSTEAYYSIGTSLHGDVLATAGIDGFLRTYRLSDLAPLGSVNLGESVPAICTSPDGRRLAVGATSGRVHVLDSASMTLVHTIAVHDHIAYGLAWANDGALVTAGLDRRLREWSASDWTERWTVVLDDEPTAIAMTADQRFVLVALTTGNVQVVDRASHRAIGELRGHTGRVWSVVAGTRTSLAATSSDDGTVRLWDPSTAALLATLSSDSMRVGAMGLAFSPDDTRIAVGGTDGSIVVWDVEQRLARATLGRGDVEGISSCATADAISANNPRRAALLASCRLAPARFRANLERATGLHAEGSRLERLR